MADRKYTAIITVSLVNPEGEHMGSKTLSLGLKLGMDEFPEGNEAADEHMESEIDAMVAAATFGVENSF